MTSDVFDRMNDKEYRFLVAEILNRLFISLKNGGKMYNMVDGQMYRLALEESSEVDVAKAKKENPSLRTFEEMQTHWARSDNAANN